MASLTNNYIWEIEVSALLYLDERRNGTVNGGITRIMSLPSGAKQSVCEAATKQADDLYRQMFEEVCDSLLEYDSFVILTELRAFKVEGNIPHQVSELTFSSVDTNFCSLKDYLEKPMLENETAVSLYNDLDTFFNI